MNLVPGPAIAWTGAARAGASAAQDAETLELSLDECLAADRPRLRRRLERLRRRAQREPWSRLAAALHALANDLERSRTVRAARTAVVPRLEFATALPFTSHRPALLELIARHQVVIVSGSTGCGKSTQLPKLCLELGRGIAGRIGHTQPRRIAARAIAARLAEETATAPGELAGYCVRFDDNLAPSARIKVMTDGILLHEIHADPNLLHYDTLLIDEAHERSLNIDFLLGYLKHLLPRRADLKVIVTSATIDVEQFAEFFPDCATYHVPEREHAVEVRYRPPQADDDGDVDLYAALLLAVSELDAEARGDILIFLPGEREIREAVRRLKALNLPATQLFTLYARLGQARQARIFTPGAQRRIVLATNVAETSLTVPRVKHVIDSGLARVSRYSPRRKLQQLPLEKIAQANADQRAGRCGREAPGICIRLYDETDFRARRRSIEAEMLRTNLAGVILRLKTLGNLAIESFPFVDAPAARFIKDGYAVLQEIGALDAARELTPIGRQLARFPIDPRLARVVVAAAALDCLREALVIVAALSISDPRERPHEARDAADRAHAEFVDRGSDFMWFVRAWTRARELASWSAKRRLRYCRRRFLSAARMIEWVELHTQLAKRAEELGLQLNSRPATYKRIHTALASGFLSQIGVRQESDYLGCRNQRFVLHPSSALARHAPAWVVATDVVETSAHYARLAARIEPQWMVGVASHVLKASYDAPHWDARLGRVRATQILRLYGLVISHQRSVDYAPIDAQAARDLFIERALVDGELGQQVEFLSANLALLARIRELEVRARRHDLLVPRATLCALYAERLPPGMCTRRELLAWLRESGADATRLRFQLADICLVDVGAGEAWLFPDRVLLDGAQLAASYRFEPGDVADGLTVRVPLPLVSRLHATAFDRLVPGLLGDKVAALLRLLPKARRRELLPLRDYVRAAVAALAGQPGPLESALACVLERITGSAWSASEFECLALEPHWRCRIEIVDDTDQVLDTGRDVSALRARYLSAGEHAFAELMREDPVCSRMGWTFGDVPERVERTYGSQAVCGFPALCDAGDGVMRRTLPSQAHAARAHHDGVARLIWQVCVRARRDLLRAMQSERKLGLNLVRLGHGAEVADWLVMGAAWSSLDGHAIPRDAQSFAQAVARCEQMLAADAAAALGDLTTLVERALALRDRMHTEAPPRAIRDDVESQLEWLLGRHALHDFGPARRQRSAVSLAALERRLERVRGNPGKDLDKLARVGPLWRRFTQLATGASRSRDMLCLHLDFEDFRIAVFAPELGTHARVSSAMLEAALALLAARS